MFDITRVAEIIDYTMTQETTDGRTSLFDFVSNDEPFQIFVLIQNEEGVYWQNDNKVIRNESDFINDCERLGLKFIQDE